MVGLGAQPGCKSGWVVGGVPGEGAVSPARGPSVAPSLGQLGSYPSGCGPGSAPGQHCGGGFLR